MRWFLLAFVALLLWVAVRWVLKASSGVAGARQHAIDALRAITPGARGIEREPGLLVLQSGEDRIELDHTAVLKAALAHKAGGAALESALRPIVEAAFLAQTDPEQLQEERDEARAVLGDEAARISDGALLRVLFGHEDEDTRDAGLHSALAEAEPVETAPVEAEPVEAPSTMTADHTDP